MSTYFAIGLMSGTSLDGLDICYSQFVKNNGTWSFNILNSETIPYTSNWENRLKNAIYISSEELLELNADYGFYLGEKVNEFIQKFNITTVDVIASHGHTVFHNPSKRYTLQIGDGRAIKQLTHIPVIYDFRSQDVLLGGNGAPLVPIGDQLLFSEFDACINLGGFSNISLIQDNKRIAFDICPVNIVLNKYANILGKNYDANGAFARKGIINNFVLEQLNHLDFYKKKHPKSLGIEWCNLELFPLLKDMEAIDVLATITEHSAIQISNTLNQFQLKKVLFTGGGSYNQFLIEKIQAKFSGKIIIPNKTIINFKEALIFAFMGVLRKNNEINVLSSTTGSSHNHSSGLIA